ncbi:hypothetical protein B0H19DRAFT_291385 [Mycena capillaripes]|nr:hypothetical protein B0H19DRAFT_291385 [Mycena capillaripes]
MSGYMATPSTAATAYTPAHDVGNFTGAPLVGAPLPMTMASSSSSHKPSPAHANSLPTPTSASDPIPMPDPFYARRRTDSERSARSGRSGKSGRSGGADTNGGSPGSTPPSARAGGMAWPAISSPQQAQAQGGGRDRQGTGASREGMGGAARDLREREWERERERQGSGGGGGGSPVSPVSISISAPLLTGAVDGSGYGFGGASGGLVGQAQGGIAPGHVHQRSHSFTPKLSSRLAGLGAVSPGRKGSAGELDPVVERDGREGKEKRGTVFPFHFGGGASSLLFSAKC